MIKDNGVRSSDLHISIQSYSNLLQEFVLLYYIQTSIKRPTSG